MENEKLLISQGALIRALGFSKATFYRRRAEDEKFPRAIKFGEARGSGVYYRIADVNEYIERLGEK